MQSRNDHSPRVPWGTTLALRAAIAAMSVAGLFLYYPLHHAVQALGFAAPLCALFCVSLVRKRASLPVKIAPALLFALFAAYYMLNEARVYDPLPPGSLPVLFGIVFYFVAAQCAVSAACRSFSARQAVYALFVLGVTLRMCFEIHAPFMYYQHDLGSLDATSNGHLKYIMTLVNTGRLPTTNTEQFYQAPLNNILTALPMRYFIYQRQMGIGNAAEMAQALQVILGALTLAVGYKLLRAARLSERHAAVGMALLAFHPHFIIFASSMNCDNLLYLWIGCALLFSARWYSGGRTRDALLTGLAFSLGIMTKVSMLAMALPAAVLYIARLCAHRQDARRELLAWALTACVAATGLWYAARNYLLFGQGLLFVTTAQLPFELSVAEYPLWQRLLTIDPRTLFNPPFARPFDDFRLWEYVLKNSMFNEFGQYSLYAMGIVLLASSLPVIALSLFAMIWCILKKRDAFTLMFGALWLVTLATFVSFNIQLPYGCSMDFRYVAQLLFGSAFFIAKWPLVCEGALAQKPGAARTLRHVGYLALFVFLEFCVVYMLLWSGGTPGY